MKWIAFFFFHKTSQNIQTKKKIVMLNDFPLITNISTLECSLKNTFVKKKYIWKSKIGLQLLVKITIHRFIFTHYENFVLDWSERVK